MSPPQGAPPDEQSDDPAALLDRAIEAGRVHAAYLISGAGEAPERAALHFARAVVCRGEGARPCGACRDCRLSSEEGPLGDEPRERVLIDSAGKKGPLYRHVGDHPDLYWVDRGEAGTRVRITQVRAVQIALRLAPNEGGWRAAVIADAEWLNQEAQNALLRLLEEPPQRTCLVLVTKSAAGLLATIRSRCQRVAFPPSARVPVHAEDAPEEVRAIALRLDGIAEAKLPAILDWAEEYRGARAVAAARAQTLLATGSEWLRERVVGGVGEDPAHDPGPRLAAFRALAECRKDLAQRNANPQMIAERALLALQRAERA